MRIVERTHKQREWKPAVYLLIAIVVLILMGNNSWHVKHFQSANGDDRRNNLRRKHEGSFIYLAFSLFLLLALASTIQPVSGSLWDGVVVTEADFQSLRAIKHELIDPKGVLRSWNDSGLGACSGGWAGKIGRAHV